MVRLPGFGVCWCATAPQRENVPMHIFSVGLSFCGTDIVLVFSNGCNGCLDAAGNVLKSHGRCRGGSSNYLLRNERNVHKAAAYAWIFFG